jgi:hypothetical protein
VTIYGPKTNDEPCSANILQVANGGQCYNASWVYYSIDDCLVNDTSSTILTPSGAATATSSAAVSPYRSYHDASPGTIAGSVVGGKVGFTLIVGLCLLIESGGQQPVEKDGETRQPLAKDGDARVEIQGGGIAEKDGNVEPQGLPGDLPSDHRDYVELPAPQGMSEIGPASPR